MLVAGTPRSTLYVARPEIIRLDYWREGEVDIDHELGFQQPSDVLLDLFMQREDWPIEDGPLGYLAFQHRLGRLVECLRMTMMITLITALFVVQ